MTDGWLSITEYATRIGHHFMTVGQYARTGRLPAVRKGQRWYVHEDAPWPSGGPRAAPGEPRKPAPKLAATKNERSVTDQMVMELAGQMLPLLEVAKRTGLDVEEVRNVLRGAL